jgi:hypothetical protein
MTMLCILLLTWAILGTWCAYDYRHAYLSERDRHRVTARRLWLVLQHTHHVATIQPHTPHKEGA